jgi:predicted phage terminase large subunit-like protein
MTDAHIRVLLRNLHRFSAEEAGEIERMVDELLQRRRLQAARDDLIEFCKYMQPDYKVGRHHRILADMLMAIERGDKDRICVSLPPRHGKSQLVSLYFAAWFMGRNPGKKLMLVSHTTDLAVDFGRKVRNVIADPAYKALFPDTVLATDSKSAGRWNTTYGGEFYAAGVGSSIAGRGADLLVVDDPHSEQDILNGNFSVFEKAYEWFTFGARTRLMPGGSVAIVHCMVGDTPVLLSDGTERYLKDIRPGDMVASYADGELVSRKVLNWANQGPDHVYTVAMDDGNLIKANARHPFLVARNGGTGWVKLKDLRPGDELVSLMGAGGLSLRAARPGGARSARTASSDIETLRALVQRLQRHARASRTAVMGSLDRALRPANALPACPETATTGKIPVDPCVVRGTGGSGKAQSVPQTDAQVQRTRADCAPSTTAERTTNGGRPRASAMMSVNAGTTTFAPATESHSRNTHSCASCRAIAAPSARNNQLRSLVQRLGKKITRLRSTIAMIAGKCAACFAIHATSSCTVGRPSRRYTGPFSTSRIMSITPDGVEDVFDIQVEGTENFIAGGVVSHNTRWSADDLIGRVIRDMTQREGADQYEVVEFPALLEVEEPDPDAEPLEDGEQPMRLVQKPLWPEFFDLKALLRTKASMPAFQWNAQYQQNPTSEGAALIKREWWREWPTDTPPDCDYIIATLDAAAEAKERADFTAVTVWGVFFNEQEDMNQLILLYADKRRVEFPELKEMALEVYQEWEPDAFIVEKKSSGTPLYQELRRMGIMVQEYTPVRGSKNNPNTKFARLNSVADIVKSGIVWIPQKRWAEELVEEVAGFPAAPNDDQVDCLIMALMRFRQGGFIRLPSDDTQEDNFLYRPPAAYY